MKEKIFENGIQYSLSGDYYLPNLKLEPESRPVGRWDRMHRDYLKEHRPVIFNQLVLSGTLWSYLADINEQAQQRMEVLVKQWLDDRFSLWGHAPSGTHNFQLYREEYHRNYQ